MSAPYCTVCELAVTVKLALETVTVEAFVPVAPTTSVAVTVIEYVPAAVVAATDMTPPLLIVIPVTVLASAVSATVQDLLPVPPEDVKAEDVVAVP
jgi:hypothetical protein